MNKYYYRPEATAAQKAWDAFCTLDRGEPEVIYFRPSKFGSINEMNSRSGYWVAQFRDGSYKYLTPEQVQEGRSDIDEYYNNYYYNGGLFR